MIDTHCHLGFPQLYDRLDEVLDAAARAGVDRMITIGTSPDDAAKAQRLAADHSQLFFTAGVHPHYVEEVPLGRMAELVELAADPKCVALGEMGLDYHYPDPDYGLQKQAFEAQLHLLKASRLGKPVVLHCRKAVDDTLAILRSSGIDGDQFVFHCCTEPPAEVRKMLNFGAMISFTGIATYKNAPEVRESALLVPDDRIMVETDAPYLSPEPHRRVRPNEPKFVAVTAAFLADLRGSKTKAFVAQADANAERFFRLPAASA